MRKRHILLLVGLALLAACAGTSSNILDVKAGSAGLVSKDITINDRSLPLAFGDIATRPRGESYEIQVTIRNKSRRDVRFEYMFTWYDTQGFETTSSWTPGVIGGKSTTGIRSTSPVPGGERFVLKIRKPHPLTESGSKN